LVDLVDNTVDQMRPSPTFESKSGEFDGSIGSTATHSTSSFDCLTSDTSSSSDSASDTTSDSAIDCSTSSDSSSEDTDTDSDSDDSSSEDDAESRTDVSKSSNDIKLPQSVDIPIPVAKVDSSDNSLTNVIRTATPGPIQTTIITAVNVAKHIGTPSAAWGDAPFIRPLDDASEKVSESDKSSPTTPIDIPTMFNSTIKAPLPTWSPSSEPLSPPTKSSTDKSVLTGGWGEIPEPASWEWQAMPFDYMGILEEQKRTVFYEFRERDGQGEWILPNYEGMAFAMCLISRVARRLSSA
jgi:hypothetical protein